MDRFRPYEAAQWIRDEIAKLSAIPRSVAIFGSFTTDNWKMAGDVDLLLVGSSLPRASSDRSALIQNIVSTWRKKNLSGAWSYPVTLSPLFITEEGWLGSVGLRLSLSESCWILRDDGFLSDSLTEARDWIAKGAWVKQPITSGGFFWIPKKGVA